MFRKVNSFRRASHHLCGSLAVLGDLVLVASEIRAKAAWLFIIK